MNPSQSEKLAIMARAKIKSKGVDQVQSFSTSSHSKEQLGGTLDEGVRSVTKCPLFSLRSMIKRSSNSQGRLDGTEIHTNHFSFRMEVRFEMSVSLIQACLCQVRVTHQIRWPRFLCPYRRPAPSLPFRPLGKVRICRRW
jgi:hypothetical protein